MYVTVRQLSFGYSPDRLLFSGVNIDARPGDVIALTGPSGSGKSTMLQLLASWLDPLSGEVLKPESVTMALVTQNPHGVGGRTALDHVTLPLLAQGLSREESEETALKQMADFGLTEVAGSAFQDLSGGERQRVLLARAVVGKPQLLLIDEPTAQLDRVSSAKVSKAIAAIAAQHSVVFIATHDPDVRDSCNRVVDLGSTPAEAA